MNLTKIAESYIQEHASVRQCLKQGLMNYSALTREIARQNNLDLKKNFDALLIACRRYKQKLKKESNEGDIKSLLKKSKMEVKNKVVAVVLEKAVPVSNLEMIGKKARKENEVFRIIEGVSGIILITSESYLKDIQKAFKNLILKESQGLAEVIIKSPKEIETLPGVLSYLSSLLGEYNINIVETMSCWTDTIFIVQEKEISKVMEVMSF